MKLSKNSWHKTFHNASFPNLMIGNNFCNYFWELVIAMVLFPLSWPFCLINAPLIPKVLLGGFIQGIIGGLVYLACTRTVEDFLITVFWILLGVSIIVSIIAIGMFLKWFFKESETSKTINRNLGEIGDIIKEGVVSTKERYCPKIDWN